MSGKPLDPVQTRKAILIVGATILLVGILTEPAILLLFTTQFGVLRIVLALVTGAVFAVGVSQVGEMALRSPIEPWYARRGAPLLITILCGVFVIGWIIHRDIMQQGEKTTSLEDIAHLFACLGLGLILTTLLNWVSYEK
jgi:predicted signal transduction protein with EAL and GGDEF domain